VTTRLSGEITLVEGERVVLKEEGYYYELKLENTTIWYSQEFRDALFALPEDYFNNLKIKKTEDKVKPNAFYKADGSKKKGRFL
jgi:hypothetical protein